MTPLRALLLAAVALLGAAAAARADGTVLRAKGCGDKIFVASAGDAYSVLTTTDPGVANDGDKLSGDVDKLGFASFYIARTGRRFAGSIDERGLNKSEVTARIAARCRSPIAYNFATGQVERAAGCGNKIIVNTPDGYAVFERLAGGIVAVGDTLSGDFNRAGRATVKNPKTGAELIVFVEDFRLSKSAVARKIAASCR